MEDGAGRRWVVDWRGVFMCAWGVGVSARLEEKLRMIFMWQLLVGDHWQPPLGIERRGPWRGPGRRRWGGESRWRLGPEGLDGVVGRL